MEPFRENFILFFQWFIASFVPANALTSSFDYSFLTKEDFNNAEILSSYNGPYEKGLTLSSVDFDNGNKLTLNELYTGKRVKLYEQQNFKGDIRGKASWTLNIPDVWRNGVFKMHKKWKNGRIPYTISDQYTTRERALLARVINQYHKKTCVRFEPKNAFDQDYLYIGKIDGCFSDVGRAGGRQELSLDDGCLDYDTAIHELMHAVGFYHEHERFDRDLFINVIWQNIDREAYDQFGRVDLTESSYYGQSYDYFSIMHYDSKAFSKNGLKTMVSRQPHMAGIIGKAMDFSSVDLTKINNMYGCPMPRKESHKHYRHRERNLKSTRSYDCSDRTTLCWRWLNHCRSSYFEKIMRQFCAKSCDFCHQINTSNQLVAIGHRYGRKR